MPPITIHNIPVAPREVQLAFDRFNLWLAMTGVDLQIEPHQCDYAAILYDSGDIAAYHRHMLIEFSSEGYNTQLFARFEDGVLTSLAMDHDDALSIEAI